MSTVKRKGQLAMQDFSLPSLRDSLAKSPAVPALTHPSKRKNGTSNQNRAKAARRGARLAGDPGVVPVYFLPAFGPVHGIH
jgi:hypothetical protein